MIRRTHDDADRRIVILELTTEGQRLIHLLSRDHERELSELVPTLIKSLTQIRRHSLAVGGNQS
jgi:DNA-binding MarR family transcriptional regulator